MPKEHYPNEQIIFEFDFRITIKSSEKDDFYYIKNKVSQIHYSFYFKNSDSLLIESEFSNIPYLILKSQFDKHFRFLGGKAYLSNYVEEQGSFVMQFTILIVQSALAYGGIRETIDYFVDDLEMFFKGSLSNDFKTKVTYKEKRKVRKRDRGTFQELDSTIRNIERNLFINRIIIGVTLFFLIIGITYILNIYNDDNFVTKEKYESDFKSQGTNPLENTKIEVFIKEKANDSIK